MRNQLKFNQWFSALKLKEKMRYLFLFIIALYILLFFGVYNFVLQKNMLNYTLESNLNTMVSIGNNLNTELNTISNMSQLIMTNKDVTNYLKNKKEQELKYSQNAVRALYDISNVFNNISSVYIFKLDGSFVNANRGTTQLNQEVMTPKWYRGIETRGGGYILRVNGGGAFFATTEEPIITFMRMINDLETQKPIGMIAINLSIHMLEQTYKDMTGNNKQFVYYDEDFRYLSKEIPTEELQNIHFTPTQFHQTTISNDRILSFYRVPNTPFIITASEKMGFSKIASNEAWMIMLVLLVLTSGALLLLSVFIARYITNPIERLVHSMNSVKTGWLRRLSLSLANDEIGDLKDSYNEMLVEINSLINKLIDKEKSIQRAELEVLQEQIKPHFLYNTLDTIRYLALQGSSESVYDALETLGNFYRKFLSKGSKEIPVSAEIGIVRDYLKLQKLRYEDVFEDIYELQEDLLDIRIPKLILQPLVENSLYHGVRLKGEKGIIKISVYSKDDMIHIVVYDTGIGMSSEQIYTMMHSEDHKSFGFKRTIERIQYHCNREDVYEIGSREGEYTEIDIRIPLNGGK